MRRSMLSLALLSALAVVAPPAGETRTGTAPPPEVPPFPGPIDRGRAPDPAAVTAADRKRQRRNAMRLAAAR